MTSPGANDGGHAYIIQVLNFQGAACNALTKRNQKPRKSHIYDLIGDEATYVDVRFKRLPCNKKKIFLMK